MDSRLPYFPRAPFDQTCLGHIQNLSGIAVFAPRRRGKTAFVVNELLPGAANIGYSTIYIDLWRNEATPELAIVEGLEKALPESKWRLSKIKGSGKAKAPAVEVGGEVELVRADDVAVPNIIMRLNRAFDRFGKSNKRWLIVMDEFQTIARSKEPGFVAALRTGIQGAPNVKLFVTGSSRRELAKMITKQSSPFMGMLMQLELPELDQAFVKNRCELVLERTKRKVSAADLMAVFERVVLVPEYLNQIVSIMIVEGIYKPAEAYESWRSRHSEGEAATVWETFSEIDRSLLGIVALRPGTMLFGRPTITWLSKQTGEVIAAPKIQAALRRLTRSGLIEPGTENGEYEIADDGMRLYLESRPPALPPNARNKKT